MACLGQNCRSSFQARGLIVLLCFWIAISVPMRQSFARNSPRNVEVLRLSKHQNSKAWLFEAGYQPNLFATSSMRPAISRNNCVAGWLTSILFYIGWGWCWWTRNLISKILWLLVCSFLHCWHSYLRLSDNDLSIEKPPQNFDRVTRVDFSNHCLWGQPLVGNCSSFVLL